MKAIIFLIDIYRKYFSKLTLGCCRFYPTCSEYARESIEKKGIMRGGISALWRIARCNQWNAGGYDPVRD